MFSLPNRLIRRRVIAQKTDPSAANRCPEFSAPDASWGHRIRQVPVKALEIKNQAALGTGSPVIQGDRRAVKAG